MPKPKPKRPKSRKSRPANIIAHERRRRALEMRRDGKSLQSIADTLQMTVSSVWETIQVGLRETVRPASEELRELELQRLDRLTERNKAGVEKGKVPAILAAVRIVEARAKLLGLSAPDQHELKLPGGAVLSLLVDTRLVSDPKPQ